MLVACVMPLDMRHHDRNTFELLAPLGFAVVVDELSISEHIVVPAGFVTDGASIPWIARIFIPKWHRNVAKASVLHDWLYSKHSDRDLQRHHADQIYKQALIDAGCKTWRVHCIYAAVRLFGASSWQTP